ncbi:Ff.00g035750.m01.CDS01 [Fusarium sp. VM40]|nr:Ff.00g035750.m01.CDS01 [Fusarium sp. VM40]
MSDPLSISASIAGLISLSTVVYQTLSNFADKVDKAPKSAKEILYAVAEMRLALLSMSGLVDKFSRISARRKAMVQLDHLVISLSRAVMTFTDLELFLSDWPEISSMQSSAWRRIRWAMKEDKATHLLKRLSENRMALIFILSILQSESDFEAHTSSQALIEQMETIMAENQEMRILMDQIGNDLQSIAGSVYAQDNASTIGPPIVTGSMLNLPTALQPAYGRPDPASEATNQSFGRATGNHNPLETQLLLPPTAAKAQMHRLTSRSSYASTYPSKRPFSIVLNSSWVYRRVKAYSLDLSLNSSKLQGRAWSMFSGVSLNDVSVISFIRLPLRLSDIPHDTWYCPIPREISPDCRNLGADDPFIIAVVGESMSGKSSLVDMMCGDASVEDFDHSGNSTIEVRRRIESCYEGRQYPVEIIDTAGLDCFQPLINQAIAESHGVIITCPVIDADMGLLSRLYETAIARKSAADSHGLTPVVIAITKHDLETSWFDDSILLRAETFAKEKGINMFHTSAKNGSGISDAFSSIFESLVKNTTRKPRLMGWKE